MGRNYFPKVNYCKDLLEKSNLEIECLCDNKEIIKKTKDLEYVITYISMNNLYHLKEKHVSIQINEIDFIYDEEFDREEFIDTLIKKLRVFLKEEV